METKVTLRKDEFEELATRGNVAIVTFNTQEMSEMFYTATQTSVRLGKNMSYDDVVARLIHARYSHDAEVALINNALEDIAGIADNTEYQEYQSWRAKCKSTAKKYLELL